jgi:hypothetical protein
MDKKLALHIAPITADELHIDDHVVASLSNATKQIPNATKRVQGRIEVAICSESSRRARATCLMI